MLVEIYHGMSLGGDGNHDNGESSTGNVAESLAAGVGVFDQGSLKEEA